MEVIGGSPEVEAYIAGHPPEVQERLRRVRATIRAIVPEAEERISYGVPTFSLHGNLVHFGGFRDHIGLYPAPRGSELFAERLAGYGGGKGTVQFPHDQPLPIGLIEEIVRFRLESNLAAHAARKAKRRVSRTKQPAERQDS